MDKVMDQKIPISTTCKLDKDGEDQDVDQMTYKSMKSFITKCK